MPPHDPSFDSKSHIDHFYTYDKLQCNKIMHIMSHYQVIFEFEILICVMIGTVFLRKRSMRSDYFCHETSGVKSIILILILNIYSKRTHIEYPKVNDNTLKYFCFSFFTYFWSILNLLFFSIWVSFRMKMQSGVGSHLTARQL